MTATTAPPDHHSLHVGSRVLVGGSHKATVRYLGPLDDQQGEWAGLEWDDPARGKHDGTHAGRRYFSCLHHPSAGSFVRLNKLLDAVDTGCSVLEAVAKRYCSRHGGSSSGPASPATTGATAGGADASGSSAGAAEVVYVATAGRRRVAVELVGAAKVEQRLARLDTLSEVVLANGRVSHVGAVQELSAALPSLTELDLSSNLISEWGFVAQLAEALPSLAVLNLSCNRLQLPGLPPLASLAAAPLPQPQLRGLSTLVLTGCGVSWARAVAVGRQLPSLRHLVLCRNGLQHLSLTAAAAAAAAEDDGERGSAAGAPEGAPGSGLTTSSTHVGSSSSSRAEDAAVSAALVTAFSALETLDLELNELSSWAELAPLSALPSLKALLLSGNRLPGLRYPGSGFTALTSLLLGNNALDSWAAVDQLDLFPALSDTRLSDNPVLARDPGGGRYEAIARVGRLQSLNGSEVRPAERWDAELNYLRHVTDQLALAGTAAASAAATAGAAGGGLAAAAPGNGASASSSSEAARQAVLAQHPRFAALSAKYGPLAPAAPPPMAGTALAKGMAEVVLACGGKELKKKLPVSLTVGRLKLMAEKLFRCKAVQQAVLLVPPPGSQAQPEDITDDESRELRYYEVADGYRLEISEADAQARMDALRAAKAAAAALQARRMEAHERAMQNLKVEEQRLMM